MSSIKGPWFAYPNALQVADKHYWFDENGRHGETPNWIIDCDSISQTLLIAAAPDMIEALKTCERWFAKHSPTSELITGQHAVHPMLEMIRATIEKAVK